MLGENFNCGVGKRLPTITQNPEAMKERSIHLTT